MGHDPGASATATIVNDDCKITPDSMHVNLCM